MTGKFTSEQLSQLAFEGQSLPFVADTNSASNCSELTIVDSDSTSVILSPNQTHTVVCDSGFFVKDSNPETNEFTVVCDEDSTLGNIKECAGEYHLY